MSGFVYVISAGERLHKIGVSSNPKRRLGAIQTSHHVELTLVASIPCEEPQVAEAVVHEALRAERLRGEWFAVDGPTAVQAVKAASGAKRPPPAAKPPPMNGPALRAWRKNREASIGKVAAEFGISRATVHRWEASADVLPAYVSYACQAIELGLSPAEG